MRVVRTWDMHCLQQMRHTSLPGSMTSLTYKLQIYKECYREVFMLQPCMLADSEPIK